MLNPYDDGIRAQSAARYAERVRTRARARATRARFERADSSRYTVRPSVILGAIVAAFPVSGVLAFVIVAGSL